MNKDIAKVLVSSAEIDRITTRIAGEIDREVRNMASEREWQLLTAERFLREDAPREELSSPIN